MTTTVSQPLTGDYELDPDHTRLGFVARHAMVTKVHGAFKDFTGRAHLDAEDPTRSTAEVTILAASIDTGNEQRDAHLRSTDFFDQSAHPYITFTSTKVEEVDPTTYVMSGDLTIKGITRTVSVEFLFSGLAPDPFGNLRAGFEGTGVVNRRDWDLTWNASLETGGVLVSDKIVLAIDVSAIRRGDD